MRDETKQAIRRTGVVLFFLYVLLLVYFLFFSESYGRIPETEQTYRYNLAPFLEIRRFWIYRDQLGIRAVITNIIGNVVGFVPFGYILPVITNRLRSGFLIVLSGFSLSFLVEVIQLVTRVGCFDVDDLILNTLGAAAGYFAFVICNILRRKFYGKKI